MAAVHDGKTGPPHYTGRVPDLDPRPQHRRHLGVFLWPPLYPTGSRRGRGSRGNDLPRLCRQSPDYKLADGLVEFLDFLAAHKIPRTIATASCGNNVRFFFDTLGLDRWFDLDKVIYNDGTLPGKPAPDLYLKAAQRLGVAPETCVIFEDSGAGIESAQRAGAKKVVGIASMKKPAELETLGVDAVIGDYTDLGKLAKILEV